jgi:hypothetical protein
VVKAPKPLEQVVQRQLSHCQATIAAQLALVAQETTIGKVTWPGMLSMARQVHIAVDKSFVQ